MSKVIGIAIFVIVGMAGLRFAAYYKAVNQRVEQNNNRFEPAPIQSYSDPGMPAQLEPLLEAAKEKGPETLKQWLDHYRGHIREPRLSEIELDYVVEIGRSNPPEARRVFATIKARNGADSPMAERIEKLSRTYE